MSRRLRRRSAETSPRHYSNLPGTRSIELLPNHLPACAADDEPGTSQQPPPPEITRGRISKDGAAMTLVIGVASNDPTSVAVANTAADQLRSVGIAATVLPLDP